MKIGFSFGRCLRSLVLGEVAYEDVLCIIARTLMPTQEDVLAVIDEYLDRSMYLAGLDPTTCKEIGLKLFLNGKILEPRANHIRPMSVPSDYIWMDLFPTVTDVRSQAVQQAWEHYRMLINLTEQLPENDYVPQHGPKHVPYELTEAEQTALNILVHSI